MTYIYHITHIDNLPAIIKAGRLWSDRYLIKDQGERVIIGFDHIKQRRLNDICVSCNPSTMVGDYVPFYFCPRSIMLYVIDRKHDELRYQDGQQKIVHLVSTVETAVSNSGDRPWAYSDGNAGSRYTLFYNNLEQMDQILDWNSIRALYWKDPEVKEKKQAEFLVYNHFLWDNFIEIGVHDRTIHQRVIDIIASAEHRPDVRIHADWYY